MQAWIRGFFNSLPIQLLFLHFRRYQVLLVFWFVLFTTIDGAFMKNYGADSLFLAPEYLGNVTVFSFAFVGIAVGMFIMSWHVTTFILFYFFRAWYFDHYKELIPTTDIIFSCVGFICGLFFVLAISFIYFFSADRTILRKMLPIINNPKDYITHLQSPG